MILSMCSSEMKSYIYMYVCSLRGLKNLQALQEHVISVIYMLLHFEDWELWHDPQLKQWNLHALSIYQD